MGYTHYWRGSERKIQLAPWHRFMVACKDIVDLATNRGVGLLPTKIDLSELKIDASVIQFNGVDDDAHELFQITRSINKFEFCKTQRKPYDTVVTACLIAAHQILGSNRILVSSDGDQQDWIAGETLYRESTGDVSTIKGFAPYSKRSRVQG